MTGRNWTWPRPTKAFKKWFAKKFGREPEVGFHQPDSQDWNWWWCWEAAHKEGRKFENTIWRTRHDCRSALTRLARGERSKLRRRPT